ncbi:MAG: histone H1 [Bacteroidia bacterium]
MENFDKLKGLLNALENDAKKFYEKGNGAAGTRLRTGLQEIKELAHELRKEIQRAKNSKKEGDE